MDKVQLSSFPRNLKVRASDTLNQILQSFNWITQTKLKTFIDKVLNLTKFSIFFSSSFKLLMA